MQPPGELARVLCVGGTDPTGAAGLLLDLRVLGAFGVDGCGAVSAVTVQTSAGVNEINPVPASSVGAQMDAAIQEALPGCVKTGMLVGIDTVLAVSRRVQRLGASTKLVVDPVLFASSGRSLLDAEGRGALVSDLIPRAALVTPNVPEAEALTGVPIATVGDMSLAADHFLAMGASAVLIKGGHLPDSGEDDDPPGVTDLLRTLDGDELRLTRPRVLGPGFRGTGCALATAIAALLAEGHALGVAVTRAGDWLHTAMKTSPGPGDGRAGPLALPPELLASP